jgi:RNA polymerase subunit RPABC4/transcription elongation factor Spt4
MAVDDAGAWATVGQFIAAGFLAYTLVLWLAGVMWAAGDIRQRTRDPFIQWTAVAIAALFFIPGLLLYLAMRPRETLLDGQERRLELEALAKHVTERPSCGNCHRAVQEDFVRCPYCASALMDRCRSCGRLLSQAWVLCAYCGEGREAVTAPAPAAPAARPATIPQRVAF